MDVGQEEKDDIFAKLKELAQLGRNDEMFRYGCLLISGINEESKDEGLQWILKAAKNKYTDAQYYLYLYYSKNEKKLQEAVYWCNKAANEGHALAQNQLGRMYLDGNGVSVDKRKAAELFQAAASQSDINGMVNLAAALLVGSGVARNPDRAIGLLRKSAKMGDPDALQIIAALETSSLDSPAQLLDHWAKSMRGEKKDINGEQKEKTNLSKNNISSKKSSIQQETKSTRPLSWRLDYSAMKNASRNQVDTEDDRDIHFSTDKLERAAVGLRTGGVDVPDNIIPTDSETTKQNSSTNDDLLGNPTYAHFLVDAKKGDMQAQYWYAQYCMNEARVENHNALLNHSRFIEGIQWLQASANQGFCAACSELGLLYFQQSVPACCIEAAIKNKKLSSSTNGKVQNLSLTSERKILHLDLAIHYLEIAAIKKNETIILFHLGTAYIHKALLINDADSGKRGLFWIERAARAGSEGAASLMARAYMFGADNSEIIPGAVCDFAKAAEWASKIPNGHSLTEKATRMLLYSGGNNENNTTSSSSSEYRQDASGGSDDFRINNEIPAVPTDVPVISAAAKRRKRRKAKQQRQHQEEIDEECTQQQQQHKEQIINTITPASVFGDAVAQAPCAQPGETLTDIFRRHKGVKLIELDSVSSDGITKATSSTVPHRSGRKHREQEESVKPIQDPQAAAEAAERELLRDLEKTKKTTTSILPLTTSKKKKGNQINGVLSNTPNPTVHDNDLENNDQSDDESDDDDELLSLAVQKSSSIRNSAQNTKSLSQASVTLSDLSNEQSSTIFMSSAKPSRDAVVGEEVLLDKDDDNGEWQLTARQKRKARRNVKEESVSTSKDVLENKIPESKTSISEENIEKAAVEIDNGTPTDIVVQKGGANSPQKEIVVDTVSSPKKNDTAVTISSTENENTMSMKEEANCSLPDEGSSAEDTNSLSPLSNVALPKDESSTKEAAIVRRDWADDDSDDEIPIIVAPAPPSNDGDDDRGIPSIAIPEYDDEIIYGGAVEESKSEPPSCPVDPEDFVDEDYGPVPETKEELPDSYGIDYSFDDSDFAAATPETKSSFDYDSAAAVAEAVRREAEDNVIARELSRSMNADEAVQHDDRDWIPAAKKRSRRGKKDKASSS